MNAKYVLLFTLVIHVTLVRGQALLGDGSPALTLQRSGAQTNAAEICFKNSTGNAGFLGVMTDNTIALSSSPDLISGNVNTMTWNTSTRSTTFGGTVKMATNYLQFTGASSGINRIYSEGGTGTGSWYFKSQHDDIQFDAGENNTNPRKINFLIGGTIQMALNSNGNLILGPFVNKLINHEYKLNVDGYIRADHIVVNSSGADFVFDDNYELMPLSDVESYIIKNRHLPEVASADEMQKNGLDVGEMETKLLQKIEELTLYVIQLKKEVDELKKGK